MPGDLPCSCVHDHVCPAHICVMHVGYTLLRAHVLSHVAQTSCGEDVFLPRCADCCGRMVLTVQSQRQESEVCQPVQLITPPLSHSGQRLFAGEPKRMMGLWRSTQRHSNCEIGIGSSSFSSLELCHVIYLTPHDAFPFSSRGVHSERLFHQSVLPLDIRRVLSHWRFFLFFFLHFVNQMWFSHRTVFAQNVLFN